jgi:hypothetical protein
LNDSKDISSERRADQRSRKRLNWVLIILVLISAIAGFGLRALQDEDLKRNSAWTKQEQPSENKPGKDFVPIPEPIPDPIGEPVKIP